VDFREIKRIVELMDQHGLSVFKLEQGETKLELKKGGDLDVKAIQNWIASAPAPQYAPAYHAAPAGAPAAAPAAEGAASGRVTVQLTPDQAALLASVRDADLYLTLNRGDYEPVPVPPQAGLPALPGQTGASASDSANSTGK